MGPPVARLLKGYRLTSLAFAGLPLYDTELYIAHSSGIHLMGWT